MENHEDASYKQTHNRSLRQNRSARLLPCMCADAHRCTGRPRRLQTWVSRHTVSRAQLGREWRARGRRLASSRHTLLHCFQSFTTGPISRAGLWGCRPKSHWPGRVPGQSPGHYPAWLCPGKGDSTQSPSAMTSCLSEAPKVSTCAISQPRQEDVPQLASVLEAGSLTLCPTTSLRTGSLPLG